MNKKKGIFITFEGPEASGKSTQINALKKFLKKINVSFITTREPGGTIISEKLRNIILNKNFSISKNEELLLLMASRLNHINTVIKPALKKGQLVISDRYCDSTFVYQDYANGIMLHKKLLNNFLPKKTFLFLLNPKTIIKRIKLRKKLNKFDINNLNFHKKIINNYQKLSKNNKRFIIINANKSFKDIQLDLQTIIIKLIS